jgi:hypothetical protein
MSRADPHEDVRARLTNALTLRTVTADACHCPHISLIVHETLRWPHDAVARAGILI